MRHRGLRVAVGSLGVLLAILCLAVLFETTWMRPLARSYVRQHADREIDFEDIRLGLDGSFRPTVTLHRLEVQNAPWATSKAPLIRAGEMAVTLTWDALWADPKVITRMVLRDADIDLERQADGLRNWRLSQPGDRGPGRIRVLRLDAQRTRVRFVHRGLALEMNLASEVAPGATGPSPDQVLSVQGARQSVQFHGQFHTPSVLTLYDTGTWFDVEGNVATANAHMQVKGRLHDLVQLGGLEGDLQIAGQQVGELSGVLGRSSLDIPALPAKASGHLVKDGEHWSVTALDARLGDSDVAGAVDYRSNKVAEARPVLRATLSSDKIDVSQWRHRAHILAAGASAADGAWRNAADVDIDWRIATVQGLLLPAGDLHAVVSSRTGHWRVAPVELSVADGHASGEVTYDAAATPATAIADVHLTRLQLDQLGGRQVGGRLDAQIALQSRGDSVAGLLAGASGEASATLVGASLPATLEAKLGLDGGRWLAAVFSGGERRAIGCATLQVQLSQGVATVRRFGLETDALLVNGAGQLDLPGRSLDLTLTPYRKQETLLALDKSVRISGQVGAVKLALVATPKNAKREPCLASMDDAGSSRRQRR